MLPVLLVLLAAVCFGTTGTAQALGAHDVDALSLGAARLAIGGTLLGALTLLLGVRARATHEQRASAATSRAADRGRDRRRARLGVSALTLLATLGVLLYQPLFFAGTAGSGVAVGTVIALGSAPVLTGLLQWALERRFPGLSWSAATGIAVLGVALIAAASTGGAQASALPGVAASIGAGASYSLYTLSAKGLMNRGIPATQVMGRVFGLAGVASIPALLASDATWILTPAGLTTALWLGVVTTALAYLCFGAGLARLPAATVSTLTLAEPLTASVLGLFVLHERLAQLEVAGLIILGLGIVVLVLGSVRTQRRLPPGAETSSRHVSGVEDTARAGAPE